MQGKLQVRTSIKAGHNRSASETPTAKVDLLNMHVMKQPVLHICTLHAYYISIT